MTAYEVIVAIRAEVERLREINKTIERGCYFREGYGDALSHLTNFLDTIEVEARGKAPATIAFERLHGLNNKK